MGPITENKTRAGSFKPAAISPTLLWLVQNFSKYDLHWRNRVYVSQEDLARFSKVPPGSGIILTPNHADEMDPRICFEISRRSKRRFVFMCNREAFNEMYGVAGWGLQRIGAFSVERGGHDVSAKRFATETVMAGRDTLVIFPEGEIFYLNQSIQPFHSGAIEIGMQALIEQRRQQSNWTAFLLPMSIRYRYRDPLNDVLGEKISRMEKHLGKGMTGDTIQSRLFGILAEVVRQKETQLDLKSEEQVRKFTLRIKNIRDALLDEVKEKHKDSYAEQARTIDQSFQLAAKLHERMAMTQSAEHIEEYREELAKLKEVEHLVSMRPDYVKADPSPERLAEMTIKLERELFNIKRPQQLGKRDVLIRIGEPIDLSHSLSDYESKPHVVRHDLAEKSRAEIQSFIDSSKV